MSESFLDGRVIMHAGDCLDVLTRLEECSVDSCVTDPPYHLTSIVKRFGALNSAPVKVSEFYQANGESKGSSPYIRSSTGFMGKQWDGGDIAFRPELWREVYRVLKPGAHLLAFGGTRTYHRMACAIEDAGFEIRDCIQWLYGSGFPKSHNVAIGIDKAAGIIGHRAKRFNTAGGETATIQRQELRSDHPNYEPYAAENDWGGWGTALKPACEPIVLARKPLSESTVAANVLKWGTGAINVDGCRVDLENNPKNGVANPGLRNSVSGFGGGMRTDYHAQGRWPANVMHDGSEEVVGAFPESKDGVAGKRNAANGDVLKSGLGAYESERGGYGTSGSAARFFYTAKADSDDRLGSKHPTVKPLDLMQYLVRLITPPKGLCLDPFAGTGTTGEAAFREGMSAVLVEREAEYQDDIRRRMTLVMGGPDERANAAIKQRMKDKPVGHGPLFASPWDEMWAVPFDFSKEPKPEAAE